ncbi:MAG: chalcone isomerase family protein [Chitinophagales bacterium]
MKLAGYELTPKIKLNKVDLFLNGAAVRSKFFVQTYIIGLYAEKAITDENEAIDSNLERCLRMIIITPLATAKAVSESIQSGMRDGLGSLYKAQKDLVDDIKNVVENSGVQYQDSVDIYYTKKGELKLYKNEEEIYHNKDGKLFAQAIFGMYVGKKPKDAKMKTALLKGF